MSRMRNGGAVLLNHSTDKQIGVVEDCKCDPDKMGRATVRFSRSALGEEVFRDVQDGIRKNVSVGYSIDEDPMQLKPEEMSEELKTLALKEQSPAYRIRRWTPYEVSMVPIPADTSVGVGRSVVEEKELSTGREPAEIQAPVAKEVRLMEKTAEELAAQQRAKEEKERQDKETRDSIQKTERERLAEIHALSSRHSLPTDLRDKWIEDGLTIEQVRHNVLKHIGTTKPIDTPPSDLGLSEGDRKRYSISRAITAAISNDWGKAGFERECSMAIDKRISGEGYNIRGTFRVPYDVPLRTEQRTVLTAGAPTTGGDLVGTALRPDLFIELLRNKMISTQLGIQMLSGLVGNIAIPSFTAAATAYWVAENTAPTAGNQTFGQITLSPKTVGAYTDFSRQLLLQATPAIDGLVQGDLSKILALGYRPGRVPRNGLQRTASGNRPRTGDRVRKRRDPRVDRHRRHGDAGRGGERGRGGDEIRHQRDGAWTPQGPSEDRYDLPRVHDRRRRQHERVSGSRHQPDRRGRYVLRRFHADHDGRVGSPRHPGRSLLRQHGGDGPDRGLRERRRGGPAPGGLHPGDQHLLISNSDR